LTCGCIEEHWQALAAFAFMGVGLAIPIYFVMKFIMKKHQDKFARWVDEIQEKIT